MIMMTVKQWKKVWWSQCGKKYKYSTCAGSVSSLGSRSRDNIYNLSGNPTCAFWEVQYITQPLVTEYVWLYLILPFHRWRLSAWNTAALTLGKLDILLASPHQLLCWAVLLLDEFEGVVMLVSLECRVCLGGEVIYNSIFFFFNFSPWWCVFLKEGFHSCFHSG